MRKFLIAALFLLASVTGARAQIFSASVRYRLDTPAASEYCDTHQPTYSVDSKKLCKCDRDAHTWMCELATVDTVILGSFKKDSVGLCIDSADVGGRKAFTLGPCVSSDASAIAVVIPPRYDESALPICDGLLEGVTVYLRPIVGSLPGRKVTCLGRTDGTGAEWVSDGVFGGGVAP